MYLLIRRLIVILACSLVATVGMFVFADQTYRDHELTIMKRYTEEAALIKYFGPTSMLHGTKVRHGSVLYAFDSTNSSTSVYLGKLEVVMPILTTHATVYEDRQTGAVHVNSWDQKPYATPQPTWPPLWQAFAVGGLVYALTLLCILGVGSLWQRLREYLYWSPRGRAVKARLIDIFTIR